MAATEPATQQGAPATAKKKFGAKGVLAAMPGMAASNQAVWRRRALGAFVAL